MKSLTIILVGLMLTLGVTTTRAVAGAYVGTTAAGAASHEDPLLADPDFGKSLFPATYQDSAFAGDEDLLASQPLTVWDYVVSPQVTIDLECRPFATEENGFDFASDRVDLKTITQNLMVGFHYKF